MSIGPWRYFGISPSDETCSVALNESAINTTMRLSEVLKLWSTTPGCILFQTRGGAGHLTIVVEAGTYVLERVDMSDVDEGGVFKVMHFMPYMNDVLISLDPGIYTGFVIFKNT